MRFALLLTATAALVASPAAAQSARELIFRSAYGSQTQPAALDRLRRARESAAAIAARDPRDEEAAVMAAAAQGYIAKLTGSRSEALTAKREFDAAATRFPRNAEAQLGVGAWHLAVINRAGRLLGAVIGASRGRGAAALARAVTLGRDQAFVPSVAGMMLIGHDPADIQGRAWLEAALRAPAPRAEDKVTQRSAAQVIALLRAGDATGASALARRALPFGWFTPAK